jgi:glutamyl-tRNA synthetase
MVSTVRTRFAPSPTGYLHIGGARTALFSWAYARRHGGQFILRIEDTDVARSTPEAVQAILDGMSWLDLNWDEGPFYQMQRMDRYKAVIQEMLAAGSAYPCYMPPEELDALREAQRARGEKPRYDGRWRPEPGKVLPEPPAGVAPVIRFRNPAEGVVAWDDLVKGRIEIANAEMDDLIIARADGTPTYNFCVCVDDWDMGITQVIRGDDHVNNTPRQIHIFRAFGQEPPVFAHLPTVLNERGEKMSKRDPSTKPVMQYKAEGYLPEALVNYLARLGWSHGDDEIFSREQFLQWFNLDHLGRSAAQFDETKLRWVNGQHIKATDDATLASLVQPHVEQTGISSAELQDGRLPAICALFKDRCETLVELANWVHPFYRDVNPSAEDLAQHITPAIQPAINALAQALQTCTWDKTGISAAIKQTLVENSLKMPQLAMPVRVLVMGTAHTPSLDAVLFLQKRENILQRLQKR